MTYVLETLLAGALALTICYSMVEIYYGGKALREIYQEEGR